MIIRRLREMNTYSIFNILFLKYQTTYKLFESYFSLVESFFKTLYLFPFKQKRFRNEKIYIEDCFYLLASHPFGK